MTIRLRPHHLLCVLTYVGEGYGARFVANYDRIVARLHRRERVRIVSEPDDIWASLLDSPAPPHCLNESVAARDRLAAADIGALLEQPISHGTTLILDASRIAAMREAFDAGVTRAACAGCEWTALCSRVVRTDYASVRLHCSSETSA